MDAAFLYVFMATSPVCFLKHHILSGCSSLLLSVFSWYTTKVQAFGFWDYYSSPLYSVGIRHSVWMRSGHLHLMQAQMLRAARLFSDLRTAAQPLDCFPPSIPFIFVSSIWRHWFCICSRGDSRIYFSPLTSVRLGFLPWNLTDLEKNYIYIFKR